MDLREYLFHKKLQVKEFGTLVDCSRSYMSRVVHKKIIPSKRLAKSIERATDGEVTVDELLGKPTENT